jgi:hypothetical protein
MRSFTRSPAGPPRSAINVPPGRAKFLFAARYSVPRRTGNPARGFGAGSIARVSAPLHSGRCDSLAAFVVDRPSHFLFNLPMESTPRPCPHCRSEMRPETIVSWRPFSCPSCQKIIEPSSPYSRYMTLGCLSTFAAALLGFVLLGLRWLPSVAIALAAGIILNAAVRKLIEHQWPRPPDLHPHILRTESDTLVKLADFLELIACAESWRPEFDRPLKTFAHQRSYDESLENVALEAAQQLRAELQGIRARKIPAEIRKLSPEALRKEIQTIARDLRLAVR